MSYLRLNVVYKNTDSKVITPPPPFTPPLTIWPFVTGHFIVKRHSEWHQYRVRAPLAAVTAEEHFLPICDTFLKESCSIHLSECQTVQWCFWSKLTWLSTGNLTHIKDVPKDWCLDFERKFATSISSNHVLIIPDIFHGAFTCFNGYGPRPECCHNVGSAELPRIV